MGYGTQQGFPNTSLPFVDRTGVIQQAWLQLLIQLWNRTGGAQGVSAADIVVQNALANFQPDFQNTSSELQLPLPSFSQDSSFGSDENKLFALMLLSSLSQNDNVSNQGTSWVPLVSGSYISAYSTEQPVFITDGAGELILVAGP